MSVKSIRGYVLYSFWHVNEGVFFCCFFFLLRQDKHFSFASLHWISCLSSDHTPNELEEYYHYQWNWYHHLAMLCEPSFWRTTFRRNTWNFSPCIIIFHVLFFIGQNEEGSRHIVSEREHDSVSSKTKFLNGLNVILKSIWSFRYYP